MEGPLKLRLQSLGQNIKNKFCWLLQEKKIFFKNLQGQIKNHFFRLFLPKKKIVKQILISSEKYQFFFKLLISKKDFTDKISNITLIYFF